MPDHENHSDDCFLCSPNEGWVWAKSDDFFAMAALGPIVEGMSIVASRAHVRSMFDVPTELSEALETFSRSAQDHLAETFDTPVHITEHGRVGLCEIQAPRRDQHCYHAHRLVFPTHADMASALEASAFEPLQAGSFDDARRIAGHLVEYLYYAAPDGSVAVGTYDGLTPRQFFRGVVADAVGRPELRSWRAHPRYALVDAAAARLLAR